VTATTPTNVDTSIPEVWAKDTLRRVKVEGFWGRFVGTALVQKSELLNKPGDLIHIQVTDPLTGAGQSGDTAAVEGNEENLATSEIKVSPILYRHGVANYRRAGKKSSLDLQAEARGRLEEWSRNKIDSLRFANLIASALPSPLGSETYTPTLKGPNSHNTVNTIVPADTLSVAFLQQVKLALRLQLAEPIVIDGFPYYALVTHPNATYQLKQESRYESWVREAGVRGESNPFFRGALAVIDGMVLYDHENVTTSVNAGSVTVAQGLAFGAEAFVEGLDEDVAAHEQQFDYGNRLGYEISFAIQPRRALELSSIQVLSAAADV
jgi:N4-gp56 family major capsid protein